MRRIPLSRRSHVIGFQPLPTGSAEHESALERDFVTLTSFLDATAVIASQPVTIRFEHSGEQRRYTPDFLVTRSDRCSELVEVKYRTDLQAGWKRFKPAFAAARTWARLHDARFRIATERGIRGPMLDAAKRLLPLRTVPLDGVLAEHALMMTRRIGSLAFDELVVALPTTREAALAVVWRLIARGALRVDLSAPIVPSTRVSAA